MLEEYCSHSIACRAGRKKPYVVSLTVKKVDEGAVIDGVVSPICCAVLVPYLVGCGSLIDGGRGPGQSRKARMEQRHVFAENRYRVPIRVKGNEKRLHGIAVNAECFDRTCHCGKIGWTDIGTMRKSEIDQQHPASEIPVGAGATSVIDQCKCPPDRLTVPHQCVHQLGGTATGHFCGSRNCRHQA